jgi:small subunit ribosomal protein S20
LSTLPNIKSAIKRVQVAERNRQRNVATKSAIRTAMKKVLLNAQASVSADELNAHLRRAFSLLDKAVLKGIVHKNTAARYKSRLAKTFHAVAS